MALKKHLNLGPVQFNPFWDSDGWKKQHMQFMLRLDHEIDGALLLQAYEKTLDVWPLLKDAFVKGDDDNLYFAENEKPVAVHHSSAIVAPGNGLNADRLCAVTYNADTVTFSGMHAYFDGGSVLMLIRGTICRYLALYYKNDAYAAGLPTPADGNHPRNYGFYGADAQIAATPFERKEALFTKTECFRDPKFVYGEGHKVPLSEIYVPSEQFMAYCKGNAASPSIMLFLLFARAAYRLHPEAALPVVSNNTMNIRALLGMDNAIMGQTIGSYLWADREEIRQAEDGQLPALAKKLRETMNAQRDLDYVLSRIDDMRNGRVLRVCAPTVSLAYMGKVDYGACTVHMKGISACMDECESVYMLSLHDGFSITIQLGMATAMYAQEMTALLNQESVAAKLTRSVDNLPEEIRA